MTAIVVRGYGERPLEVSLYGVYFTAPNVPSSKGDVILTGACANDRMFKILLCAFIQTKALCGKFQTNVGHNNHRAEPWSDFSLHQPTAAIAGFQKYLSRTPVFVRTKHFSMLC